MNFRHLQYFIKVVQSGSIKGAAEQLGVSQPTISAAIRNLEEEFSARLLDRRREGSVPTECGRTLYDSAITMNSIVQNVHDNITAIKDPSRGHLRIGTGPSVSPEHVGTAVAQLLNDFPEVRVTHVTGDTFETFEQLLSIEDIDVALCHVPEQRLPNALNSRLISQNRIGAIIATSNMDAGQDRLSSTMALREFSWITPRDDEIRPPEGASRSRESGRSFPVTSITEDLQMIRRLTLTTRSIGFLPLHMVESELQDGTFVELILKGTSVSRPIYALTRISRDDTPLTDRFLDVAARVFAAADDNALPHRTVRLVS